MKTATLCFLIDKQNQKILLGLKKRGFGKNKYNGFGGKVEKHETIENAVLRELNEECNVKAEKFENVAELEFFFRHKPEWNQTVHVFISEKWTGEPQESEEMKPEWFSFEKIPFEKMWMDDRYWLPLVISGKKVKAEFIFGEDNETISEMKIGEK